jgi:hypothetical protein
MINVRRKLTCGLCLAAFSYLLAGCGGSGASTGGGTLNSTYFPFSNGGGSIFWRYRDSNASGGDSLEFSYVASGAGTYAGQATQTIDDSSPGVPDALRHYVVSGDGVKFIGFDDGTDNEVHTNDYGMKYAMAVGDSEVLNDTVTGTDPRTHQYRLERLANESVTVPAGTYNCAKFQRTTLAVSAGGEFAVGEVETIWFAPNVGIVKTNDVEPGPSGSSRMSVLLEFGNVS